MIKVFRHIKPEEKPKIKISTVVEKALTTEPFKSVIKAATKEIGKTFFFPINGHEGHHIPVNKIATFYKIEKGEADKSLDKVEGTQVLLHDFVRTGPDSATIEFITTLTVEEIRRGLGW